MYFPKNKIRTGLYTSGREFVYLDDLTLFTGYYYSLYDGTFFEGKSPTKGNREIIPVNKIPPDDTPVNNPKYLLDSLQYNTAYIIPTNQVKNVPISSFRSPSPTDYNIGQYVRYFCRKANEPVFLEIDRPTYNALYSQNENWVNLYVPFQIYWLIAGDYQQVIKTNKINVVKKEQSLQVYGFTQYIEKNGGYDKYYF